MKDAIAFFGELWNIPHLVSADGIVSILVWNIAGSTDFRELAVGSRAERLHSLFLGRLAYAVRYRSFQSTKTAEKDRCSSFSTRHALPRHFAGKMLCRPIKVNNMRYHDQFAVILPAISIELVSDFGLFS